MNWTFFILLMLCLIIPVVLVDLYEMGKRARRKGRTRSKKEGKRKDASRGEYTTRGRRNANTN